MLGGILMNVYHPIHERWIAIWTWEWEQPEMQWRKISENIFFFSKCVEHTWINDCLVCNIVMVNFEPRITLQIWSVWSSFSRNFVRLVHLFFLCLHIIFMICHAQARPKAVPINIVTKTIIVFIYFANNDFDNKFFSTLADSTGITPKFRSLSIQLQDGHNWIKLAWLFLNFNITYTTSLKRAICWSEFIITFTIMYRTVTIFIPTMTKTENADQKN